MCTEFVKDLNTSAFEAELIAWFHEVKRELPWRETLDPYKIWVSEIMLQQTRVDTVVPYFLNFLEKFPTVEALAEAPTDDVLKAWEGLGYYSRARNLQFAAREVVDYYDGIIPANPTLLGKLKGIGPYTQGAIMSIAFQEPEPAVDGNVMRVMSRILRVEDDIAKAKTRKIFEEIIREIITDADPSAFNQGLMELGATVCTPTKPMCLFCPVQEYCSGFAAGVAETLPVKSKAKRKKQLTYDVLLIEDTDGKVLIQKREEKGLLAGLWQFPMIEEVDSEATNLILQTKKDYGLDIEIKEQVGTLKHIFTHIVWNLKIYRATCEKQDLYDESMRFINQSDLEAYTFPVSHQKVMAHLNDADSID